MTIHSTVYTQSHGRMGTIQLIILNFYITLLQNS